MHARNHGLTKHTVPLLALPGPCASCSLLQCQMTHVIPHSAAHALGQPGAVRQEKPAEATPQGHSQSLMLTSTGGSRTSSSSLKERWCSKHRKPPAPQAGDSAGAHGGGTRFQISILVRGKAGEGLNRALTRALQSWPFAFGGGLSLHEGVDGVEVADTEYVCTLPEAVDTAPQRTIQSLRHAEVVRAATRSVGIGRVAAGVLHAPGGCDVVAGVALDTGVLGGAAAAAGVAGGVAATAAGVGLGLPPFAAATPAALGGVAVPPQDAGQ